MRSHDDQEMHNLMYYLKAYKYTSIYSAVVLTLILLVFVVSEIVNG